MYQEKELKGKEWMQTNHQQRTVGTPPIQLASVIGNQAMLQLMGLKKEEKKPNTTGIPDQMKQNFKERSGLSFDDVNVHYNSDKPAQLQALAYTQGNQVYIGPGQEKHLGHELGHVVQQKQGRVRATTNVNGMAVNDDERLEREADLKVFQRKQIIKTTYCLGKTSEIAQLQVDHVRFEAHEQIGNPAVIPAGLKPLMVFEVFGDNPNQLRQVYNQSCAYDGHTICIMGINVKTPNSAHNVSAQNNLNTKKNELSNMIAPALSPGHKAYMLPFLWWPTALAGGYDLPYFEVRSKLMEIANTLTADEENVLYRWIDRDATNDTSNNIDQRSLNTLTDAQENGTALYLSGAYNWGAAPGATQRFINFLPHLNAIEQELRSFWFKLNRKYKLNSKNYYLPEPTLTMNKLAHQEAKQRLIAKHAQIENGGQQRESEVAAGIKAAQSPKIKFSTQLTVAKPDKQMPDSDHTYLHELSSFINTMPKDNLINFRIALQGTRQSAFDNGQWSFIDEDPWNNWHRTANQERNTYAALGDKTTPEAKKTLAQYRFNDKRRELSKRLYETF